MLSGLPSLPFDTERVSPLILEAVTCELTLEDRTRTEQMRGSKRTVDAGALGAPPLFRRACRGVLKGRYEQAALALPALLLGGVSIAACYVTLPTIGLLNKARGKPQSEESAWEHRFAMAVDGHLTSRWARTPVEAKQEHIFMDWVKGELALKPDRIRYSEKIWWHMRKWSRELSMREKMIPR